MYGRGCAAFKVTGSRFKAKGYDAVRAVMSDWLPMQLCKET